MKKHCMLLIAILLLSLGASAAAAGWGDISNGLVVPSAESCMAGVPSCDDVSHEAKYYTYRYAGCGEESNGVGSNAVWAQFEAYAQHLGSTGVYKIQNHEITDFGRNTWYLQYTGPEEVQQFQPEVIYDGYCAIIVRSYQGNVIVFYSNDIATNDLKETMARFCMPMPKTKAKETTRPRRIINFDVSKIAHYFDNGTPTPAPATPVPATPAPVVTQAPAELRECEICEDGNCKRCGGDGYAYRTVLDIRTGKHETVNGHCTAQLCLNGSCTACGGDGWLGN